MSSVENIQLNNENNNLGHKFFAVHIHQKLNNQLQSRNIKINIRKLHKETQRFFTDQKTNEIINNLAETRVILKNEVESIKATLVDRRLAREALIEKSCSIRSSRYPLPNNDQERNWTYLEDPAEPIINDLHKIIESTKETFIRKEPLQMQDLDILCQSKNNNKLKTFYNFYGKIKSSILTSNTSQIQNSEDTGQKPHVKFLCEYLTTKVNKGNYADENLIKKFTDSKHTSKEKYTPAKLSLQTIDYNLSRMGNTKTTWHDDLLSPYTFSEMLKQSKNLRKITLKLFKISFQAGIVPQCLTKDKAIFLFKQGKGNKDDVSCYRPISIDAPLIKLQCQIFNEEASFLLNDYEYKDNYSYKAKRSTHTAILAAAINIQNIISEGFHALIICTDCSGAFETIQLRLIESLLTEKMNDDNHIRYKAWIGSYLRDKKLYGVSEENEHFLVKCEKVDIAGPQGSKTSPILWNSQSSFAVFSLIDYIQQNKIILNHKSWMDLIQLIFADDNFAVLKTVKLDKINNIQTERNIINLYMNTWENIMNKCGMLLNQTKSEVLIQKNLINIDKEELDEYPPIKSHIKWLGINLKLNKKGNLVADIEITVASIKSRTWPIFKELLMLCTNITVRRRIYICYIEPIIYYSLILVLLEENKKKAIRTIQRIQNTFTRAILNVGTRATINELERVLQIKSVHHKTCNMAKSEWDKLQEYNKDYKPIYVNYMGKQTIEKKTILDNLWHLKEESKMYEQTLETEEDNKFNLQDALKFKNDYQNKMVKFRIAKQKKKDFEKMINDANVNLRLTHQIPDEIHNTSTSYDLQEHINQAASQIRNQNNINQQTSLQHEYNEAADFITRNQHITHQTNETNENLIETNTNNNNVINDKNLEDLQNLLQKAAEDIKRKVNSQHTQNQSGEPVR